MKRALCLAGGGIKGVAHIGDLKAFEEENIEFECISGTSSGSIVATLNAVGYSSNEIYELFKKYCKKIHYIDLWAILDILKTFFMTGKFIVKGFNSGRLIEKIINEACNKRNISNINQIKKEILIPSIDLENGSIYFFSSIQKRSRLSNSIFYVNNISVGKAVRASCSYPGIFCPCEYEGRKFIDGGIRENVPWKEWKNMNIDKVVCIGFETKIKNKRDKNMIDIINNSLDILCYELSNYELDGVDCLLKIETKDVSLLDVKEIDYLYKIGYEQTKKFLKNQSFNINYFI